MSHFISRPEYRHSLRGIPRSKYQAKIQIFLHIVHPFPFVPRKFFRTVAAFANFSFWKEPPNTRSAHRHVCSSLTTSFLPLTDSVSTATVQPRPATQWMEWIGCLRGITMLLMVICHCEIYPAGHISQVTRFCEVFRMPLF